MYTSYHYYILSGFILYLEHYYITLTDISVLTILTNLIHITIQYTCLVYKPYHGRCQ